MKIQYYNNLKTIVNTILIYVIYMFSVIISISEIIRSSIKSSDDISAHVDFFLDFTKYIKLVIRNTYWFKIL